jgi:hypothetical protein
MRFLVLTALLLTLAVSAASGAMLRVVEQSFEFDTADTLAVDVVVEDAATIAGLEFSIIYPGDVLAVVDPTSHEAGDFLADPVVNHDGDASGLEPGMRRIEVALAAAEPAGTATGVVLTIFFPVRCEDYAGDPPTGRSVDIQVVDGAAWGIGPGSLPEAIALTQVGASLRVDCTTVPVSSPGFSTLKARFRRGD